MGCYNRWFYQDFTGRQKYFSTWQKVAKTKYEYYVISSAAWPQCFHIFPIRCHVICISRSPRVRLCWLFISEASWGLSKGCKTVLCIWFICFCSPVSDVIYTLRQPCKLFIIHIVCDIQRHVVWVSRRWNVTKRWSFWVIRGHLAEPIGQYNSFKILLVFCYRMLRGGNDLDY